MIKDSLISSLPTANILSMPLVGTEQCKTEVVDTTFVHSGTVYRICDKVVRECGFSKRELVLLTRELKPKLICFEFLNKQVELLDGLEEGEKIIVRFRIDGREWSGKFLNNLIGCDLVRECEQEVKPISEEAEEN